MWWNKSKFAQADYMPQDSDPMGSEDYVTVKYFVTVFLLLYFDGC